MTENKELKTIIRELPCRFSLEKKLQYFKHTEVSWENSWKERYKWKHPNVSLEYLGSEEWQDLWILGTKVILQKEWQDLWILGTKVKKN